MPWSGGSFSRTNGVNTGSTLWADDRDAGTKIRADRHDTHDQDLADGINACLKKDGGNTVTGTIDFDGNKLILDADQDTSITADSDDRIDVEVAGTDAVQIGHDSTNSGAFLEIDPGAFTAQANTSVGRLRVGNSSAVTVPAGTTAIASSLYLEEPNLTATGTVTDAATIYIEGAPTEGTDNHAILIAGGAVTQAKGADIASATTADIGSATGDFVDITGTTTITGLGTVQAGAQRIVQFDAALTLTHNASSLILPGGANITTAAGDTAKFISLGSGNWVCAWYVRAAGIAVSDLADGTDGELITWDASGVPATVSVGTSGHVLTSNGAGAAPTFQASPSVALGTEQASTSGTSIDFTSISSDAKQITINLVGVSTSGTDHILVQLGDSGGVETSGYSGSGSFMDTAVATGNPTDGFHMRSAAAASVRHGTLTLTLEDATNNTWVAQGGFGLSNAAGSSITGGSKSLSGTLDRVRITTDGGSDTFDAGAINITVAT